jgi:hypothetical protein
MIGWMSLLFIALWTLGLVILLAILSLAHWLARLAVGPNQAELTRAQKW